MDTLKLVTITVTESKLISQSDSVLIALSGGPDSVALLHLLTRLRKKMKLTLNAVYINHQIRKRAALREEQFCRELCDRYGVNLTIIRENIPARARREKKGLEECARDFRYDTFERLADEHGCNRIALGHHADDRVETILFRIIRGTGPTGLAGIPIKRGRIIRPLFELTKSDILAYLKRYKLEYCHDSSNDSPRFARNYIRNRLLPEIRRRLNPKADQALLNLAETISEEDRYLNSIVDKAKHRIVHVTPGGKIELDLSAYGAYDRWIRRRLVRRCVQIISAEGTAPDKSTIDRLETLEQNGGKAISLPGKMRAAIIARKLLLYPTAKLHFRKELVPGRTVSVPHVAMSIAVRQLTGGARPIRRVRRSLTVTLDAERIALPLVVRNLESGDRFQPLGMRGTKKIGDYLTDRKVLLVYRDEIPVVCDQNGIVWLVGYEIADRVKITGTSGRKLKIEVRYDQTDRLKTV
ncbi:MAG TPA: tRNA lysidine(34) synthetase TilS [Candidatus Acidoferrum sp.]|nr:tRNA lysidine(34) synthetase TilS [Candidatus Acidoferrum sp.]